MKKTIIIIACAAFAFGCGNNNGAKATDTKDTAASTPPASTTLNAGGEKALELIGSSDCTTCHRLQKASAGAVIGPAYSEVAAKYAPAADSTVDRLVKKIISGGTGVWGALPMTPHPALKEADVREMVKYILTLK
ncbi:MAG TPA: c-type cytochrome [Puia sp.]|jgi:cytochrome c|nr:c-type cytochrome [Puia sp.]